jgi:hypothetical protein
MIGSFRADEGDATMSKHGNDDRTQAAARRLKRAKLEALLFTAGTIATTVLTLGMLADGKLPKYQSE